MLYNFRLPASAEGRLRPYRRYQRLAGVPTFGRAFNPQAGRRYFCGLNTPMCYQHSKLCGPGNH